MSFANGRVRIETEMIGCGRIAIEEHAFASVAGLQVQAASALLPESKAEPTRRFEQRPPSSAVDVASRPMADKKRRR